FYQLYEIASYLNKEFSLYAVLRKALEKTTEILELETGWIWLTEADHKSVYLAASYNLPPALSQHPERLSGWCYCIKQYLSDDIEEAVNISEIACSRLKEIKIGTQDLQFHATIPIIIQNQKVGLMNLLSKESRNLNAQELTILNTISELVGTAIQRTRFQAPQIESDLSDTKKLLSTIVCPGLDRIITQLEQDGSNPDKVKRALKDSRDLRKQLELVQQEMRILHGKEASPKEFQYPETPLTKRELEVLQWIKKGLTNEQIGQQLFISERTVKFHITAILSKLHASNRTEAVDIALKRGLLGL
ncbi:MAG: LuxR C-terminal-related transcriptional regulator, partial [Bacteroidota bacterium]